MTNDITEDLMSKVADDVTRAITRTLAIAPDPRLPIALSAVAAAIGTATALLQRMAGDAKEIDPECVMLAGLLGARIALDPDEGTSLAYADLDCLKSAGRLPGIWHRWSAKDA
jgi:hypothetical protein